MASCPCCLGEGSIDMRDMNATLAEHLTDEELRYVSGIDEDWLHCDECEGTGVVSEGRARELYAAARAAVDQVLAKLEAR